MKRKLLPLLLALAVCLSLMPVGVSAAQTGLPDWYFLFAIFKNVDADCTDMNGETAHQVRTISQEQIEGNVKLCARAFEEYMNASGVMRAHVDIVEIDKAVTEMDYDSVVGAYINVRQAEPFLREKVDLDRYDHVFCISSTDGDASYGNTVGEYENGAGHVYIDLWDWEIWKKLEAEGHFDSSPEGLYVHEFLHFMERLSARFGNRYFLHQIGDLYTAQKLPDDKGDIIHNCAKGDFGTGVDPRVWHYPPHIFRTTYEWTIPSDVTNIGRYAFWKCAALTHITIPGNVSTVKAGAFMDCTNLSEITFCPGVTEIEDQVFYGCTALAKVYIPASMTSIREAAFYKTSLTDVYYGGTEAQWRAIQIGEHNGDLTNANIHYQSEEAAEPQKPEETVPAVSFTDVKSSDWFAKPVAWAVEKGITSGTSEATFSPNKTCTHGQIITFLWRAAGSPDPSAAVALKGVEPDVYYYKALQWAVAAEITADGPFYPDAACTRGDTVTYLWKLAGSPSAKAASFTDVPSSAACAQAVSWAVEQGVTGGTSETTFSPDRTCTRGQIVTFLYAALA